MIRKGKWCETYRTSFHYDTVVGFEIDIDAVVIHSCVAVNSNVIGLATTVAVFVGFGVSGS